MEPRAPKRGPRGAGSDTRTDILRAALRLFTDLGYDHTSMRAIAHASGVDPSLPRHYFPSKSRLFVEALGPFDGVDARVAHILDGPQTGLGERITTMVVGFWDSEEYGPRLRAILTSAVSSPEIGEVARMILFERLIRPLVAGVSNRDVDARAAGVASQFFGLVATRYIFKIEPLASASHEEIVRYFAPNVQRFITGEWS